MIDLSRASTWIKLAGAIVLYVVCFIVAAMPFQATDQPDPGGNAALALLVYGAIMPVFILFLLDRLTLSGWKLYTTTVHIVWGSQTLMTQIETVFFIHAFPALANQLPMLFLSNLFTLLLFVPVCMRMFGKFPHHPFRTQFLHGSPAKSILMVAALYVLLYFFFGHFVAWQFETVRVFYTGTSTLQSFSEGMKAIVVNDPWLIPFQVFRGILWALLGVIIVRNFNRGPINLLATLIVVFALMPTIQLIFPNPYMPPEVRWAHFIEVLLSNTLLAGGMYFLLRRRQEAEFSSQ